jgi:hypothetical protein
VPLLAAPPPDALAELFADPEVDEPFVPLLAGLLKVELLPAAEDPPEPADAVSEDPAELLAPLLVLPWVDAEDAFFAAVEAWLAFSAALEDEALFAALDLFALLELLAVLVLEAFLLALWLALRFLLDVALLVELLVLAALLEADDWLAVL